ncbi:hypothetical protein D3C84_827290 [compost metagenome]
MLIDPLVCRIGETGRSTAGQAAIAQRRKLGVATHTLRLSHAADVRDNHRVSTKIQSLLHSFSSRAECLDEHLEAQGLQERNEAVQRGQVEYPVLHIQDRDPAPDDLRDLSHPDIRPGKPEPQILSA